MVIVEPFMQQRTDHMKGGLAGHSNENEFLPDYATKKYSSVRNYTWQKRYKAVSQMKMGFFQDFVPWILHRVSPILKRYGRYISESADFSNNDQNGSVKSMEIKLNNRNCIRL